MKKTISKTGMAAMITLREKVAAWRSNKQQRYMPKELWSEAIKLAREFGVHPVSQNVNVSYTRLKKLVDGERPKRWTGFVEVSPGRPGGGAHIEIQRPDGCRMSVQNTDAQTASAITSTFLGQRH